MDFIEKIVSKTSRFIIKQAPTILTYIGSIGVIVTTVMAINATPKALQLIDKRKEESNTDNLSKLETLKTTWKCYIPATFIGLSTIGCILGANVLNKNKQASLIGAYSLLNSSFLKYKDATKKVYGDDANNKISAQMAKDVYISGDWSSTFTPDSISDDNKVLFYDEYSERYFQSAIVSVVLAEYHFNRNLILKGFNSINDFYSFLGIDNIEGGDDIGFDLFEMIESGIEWLDFNNKKVTLDDGLECYIISTALNPIMI